MKINPTRSNPPPIFKEPPGTSIISKPANIKRIPRFFQSATVNLDLRPAIAKKLPYVKRRRIENIYSFCLHHINAYKRLDACYNMERDKEEYKEEVFHIALRDSPIDMNKAEWYPGHFEANGAVYNPNWVFQAWMQEDPSPWTDRESLERNTGAIQMYNAFFEPGASYRYVPLYVGMLNTGARKYMSYIERELVKKLEVDYEIELNENGIIKVYRFTPFVISEEQADKLIADLTENPRPYCFNKQEATL